MSLMLVVFFFDKVCCDVLAGSSTSHPILSMVDLAYHEF